MTMIMVAKHQPTSRQVSMRQARVHEYRVPGLQHDTVEEVDDETTNIARELTVQAKQQFRQ